MGRSGAVAEAGRESLARHQPIPGVVESLAPQTLSHVNEIYILHATNLSHVPHAVLVITQLKN
jgi:hypothetical protein